MENEFEEKILEAIEKFKNKNVKITQTGIIDSAFYIEKFKYTLEEGILVIEQNDDIYLQMDLDDIEEINFEYFPEKYAILTLRFGRNVEIELKFEQPKVTSLKKIILKELEETGIFEDLCQNKTCNV